MSRSSLARVYPLIVAVFLACAVVQVFLAGLGVFDRPSAFLTHRDFGYLFGWLTLVILVLALAGRMPRRIVGMSALLLVQFALQSVFVALRTDLPWVAALHPLNGFAILLVAVAALRASWLPREEPVAAVTGSAAAEAASGAR
jgi:Family of unknown function (DUF6220)